MTVVDFQAPKFKAKSEGQYGMNGPMIDGFVFEFQSFPNHPYANQDGYSMIYIYIILIHTCVIIVYICHIVIIHM